LVLGFVGYTLAWAAVTALYAALVGAGLQSGSGATAVVCLSIVGYLSSFLFIYADVKNKKYLEKKLATWTTIPTWVSFAISIVFTLWFLAVGIALLIVGGILMFPEMIVVGGASVVFAVVLAVWTLSHVISPKLFEAMRNAKMSSHVAVGLVYAFAAAVTIVHIVTVIYYGLQFSSLTYQPSYWLYSVLIAILFEFVIVKAAIFLLDIFGVSTVYKFIEIVFFKEEWTAPTPTEVYGMELVQQQPTTKTTGKVTKAIKGATQETFEKGFEEEEFGNLGPIEEEKKESETNSEPKHAPQEEIVEEEVEHTAPKDFVEHSVHEEKISEMHTETRPDFDQIEKEQQISNPTHVNVEDLF